MSSLGRDMVILPKGGFFPIYHLCPVLPVQGTGESGRSSKKKKYLSALVAAVQVSVVMLLVLWCKELKGGIVTQSDLRLLSAHM